MKGDFKMRFERMLSVVDSHTAGEGTRLVIGGVPQIPGKTMMEKVEYFTKHLDFIRTGLTREPRIHQHMIGAIITPPVTEKGDFGMFFMNPDMCIHGTIGVVTSLIECGMVSPTEPVTEVNLDTPVGLITGYARIQNGVVESVTVRGVPSFLHTTLTIDLPKIGNVAVDIAFGGNFYACISGSDLGIRVLPENIRKLTDITFSAIDVINASLKSQGIKVQHPEMPSRAWKGFFIIYGESTRPEAQAKNFTVGFRDLKNIGSVFWDRSPCGTGTCARMAMEYSYGRLKLNQDFINESIIGTIFRGKLISSTWIGGLEAVVPEVTGSAYITALSTQVMSSNDPFKYGFPFEVP